MVTLRANGYASEAIWESTILIEGAIYLRIGMLLLSYLLEVS